MRRIRFCFERGREARGSWRRSVSGLTRSTRVRVSFDERSGDCEAFSPQSSGFGFVCSGRAASAREQLICCRNMGEFVSSRSRALRPREALTSPKPWQRSTRATIDQQSSRGGQERSAGDFRARHLGSLGNLLPFGRALCAPEHRGDRVALATQFADERGAFQGRAGAAAVSAARRFGTLRRAARESAPVAVASAPSPNLECARATNRSKNENR